MIRQVIVCDLDNCKLELYTECWGQNSAGKFILCSAGGDTSLPAATDFQIHACCKRHATELERNKTLGPPEFHTPQAIVQSRKIHDGKMAAANDQNEYDDELLS